MEEPKRPLLVAKGEPGNFEGLPGKIGEVSGRLAAGGQQGLPAIDKITFRMEEDGRQLEFGSSDSGPVRPLDLVAAIFPQSFARIDRERGTWSPACPICGADGPMKNEHVPQGPLGGQKMTMTCERCNNNLGSVVESELQHWFDHALVRVAFEHEDVPGRRLGPRLLYLDGPDGFALVPEHGDLPSAVVDMLRAGTFSMHYRKPDPRRFRLALLKHAYLAACLYLGYVPNIPDAGQIRAALIAARDTPKSIRPEASTHAERLTIYRSNRPPQGPPLAIMATRPEDSDEDRVPLISLAGTLFVSWPFSVVPPRRQFRIVPMFE